MTIKEIRYYQTLITIIAVIIAIPILSYIYLPALFNIINSSAFLGTITLLVGSSAIYLYTKQKKDYKRDAANIILMEIRHAENMIEQLKKGSSTSMDTPLLPNNNWNTHNYLFIKDLDRDELDLINNFYNQCLLIDKALPQLNINFQLEQKSNHIHNTLVQMALSESKVSDDEKTNIHSFNQKKQRFLKIIENDGHAFAPILPREKINMALGGIDKITTSMAGNKLKETAKIE